LYFKPWGSFYKKILFNFDHFFVQNEESVQLLKHINITDCTLAGDTRFDRVYHIVKHGEAISVAEEFKGGEKVFVIGSSWDDDMEVLIPFINRHSASIKFIIAPHEISEEFIKNIEDSIQVNCMRFSTANHVNSNDYRVMIIDNVGMLSRLYRYGEYAFVGGGFSVGLHNILEAACYGIPIFFGNRNYQKYEEANQLINRGGAFEVADFPDLEKKFNWLDMPNALQQIHGITKEYVEENLGATEKIMKYCKARLKAKDKLLQPEG
jgi:3-deoxy-D-manno-octulosonic-acid transferase